MLNENTARFSSGCTIAQAKKNANRLKKTSKLKLAKALDLIAASAEPGCNSWPAAIAKVTERYTIKAPDLTVWPPQTAAHPLQLEGAGIMVLIANGEDQNQTNRPDAALAMATCLYVINNDGQRRQYWATTDHSPLLTSADGGDQPVGLTLANLSQWAPDPGSLVVIDSPKGRATTTALNSALRLANAGAIICLLTNDPADVSRLPGERILKVVTVTSRRYDPIAHFASPESMAEAVDRMVLDMWGGGHKQSKVLFESEVATTSRTSLTARAAATRKLSPQLAEAAERNRLTATPEDMEQLASHMAALRHLARSRVEPTNSAEDRFNRNMEQLGELTDKLEMSLARHLGPSADAGASPSVVINGEVSSVKKAT